MTAHGAQPDNSAFSGNQLFQSLEPEEIDELRAIARRLKFATDEVVFEKGDAGDSLYTIVEGRIGITTTSEDGKEIVLNILDAGDVFGEIALLDGKERTAGAVAMSPAVLLRVDRIQFLPFLERHPQLCIAMMIVLCERLRWTSNIIEDTIFLDIPHRLAKRLLVLAVQYGKPTAYGIRIDMKLSQEKLGQMLGVTRESVNKGIRFLEDEGIIMNDDGYIVLRNIDGLNTFLTDSFKL